MYFYSKGKEATDMGYMRTITVCITQNHPLFDYAETVTRLANHLSNAIRFRQRQVLTAVSKPATNWSANEQEVMKEILDTISQMKRPVPVPTKENHFLGYSFLDSVMKYTKNPDYYAKGLPRQTAQYVLKQAVRDMKTFYASCRAYAKDPSAFTGKPKLPGYKKKGGHTTATVSNQDCIIKLRNGKWYAEFPFIKEKPVCIGFPIPDARLKQACIIPENGRYRLTFQFEVEKDLPEQSKESHRICAIDFGVDNLMAVTNNCGIASLLYKGGPAKASNQWYNKTIAKLVSEQTLQTGKKFIPDETYYAITNQRNDQVSDYLHKCAKHFVTWCVENRIDTVVMGVNKYWKQNSGIGHQNNQEFVQLPITKLREILQYLCEWNGIRCIEQEESYTSKASFPDHDPIPVYRKEDSTKYTFSGKRKPTHYAGMYKKDGFRGLYKTPNGTIINSDLNGSANILRKAYPQAFDGESLPCFENVFIILHPDYENQKKNRQKQLQAKNSFSKSEEKRQRRKECAFRQTVA